MRMFLLPQLKRIAVLHHPIPKSHSFPHQLYHHQSPVSYSRILRACVHSSDLTILESVHAECIKIFDSSPPCLFIHNHLMRAYFKCGDTTSGLNLFDEMTDTNVVSWTVLIAGLGQNGLHVEAFSFFSRMQKSGIWMNEFTLVSTLSACSFPESLSLVCLLQVYSLMIRLGFNNNVYLVNAFLTALTRNGLLDEASDVFGESSEKDIVSWNAMLHGYLKFKCENVPHFWLRMISEGIEPDDFSFATVLTGLSELSSLELGMQVHTHLVKSGHGSERCVANALQKLYLKNRSFHDGFRVFEEMPVKDVCSWTQVAAGCLSCGDPAKSLRVIRAMRSAGITPNKYTIATELNACANLSSLEEGQKIHGTRIKLGENADVCVDNALLDLYAKCGCMDEASKVFRSMDEYSVVSWTTMIMGYAQNGDCEEALKTFDQMRSKGMKPNHVTFICVLYACSQVGCIESGLRHFRSMSQAYGIDPREDHYACLVNLVSRAGRIEEAEEIIRGMPHSPSVVIWQTLLGACRLHGDVDAAQRAAENALAVGKNDSSTYVLLSNTFANFENWSIVGKLRQWLVDMDTRKMPGSSWL